MNVLAPAAAALLAIAAAPATVADAAMTPTRAGSAAAGSAVAPAPAAPCTGGVRYARTSNTIYLSLPRAYTLSSIKAACAIAPVALVDARTRTWQLNADVLVTNGARLVLHGTRAKGDVNTLRLRSRASNLPTEVSALTAMGGTIDADSVTVTSWDDQAGAVDKQPALPAGALPKSRGRAFVRAISSVTATGALQSRMTINRSNFTNLGYNGAEAYGVSYKSRQCSRATPAACAKVPVTGWQRNSNFIGNYMGTYFWGGANMQFVGNRYASNVSYGLDGHDYAKNIAITANRFDHNGNHGVICSQRCDRISIVGNTADHNGMVPWKGAAPQPGEPAGQVHGIMIHRGVTHAVISGNKVSDHPTGAGIAVLDTANAVITQNTVVRAKYGLRLSVGSTANRFQGNQVVNSGLNAIISFPGAKDRPAYTTLSGRPTANVFVGNVLDGAGSSLIRLTDSDRFSFVRNVLRSSRFPLVFERSAGHVMTGNTVPAGQVVTLTGTPGRPSSVTITPGKGVVVKADRYSKAVTR